SYGLRFETQSNVDNKANFAPRIGVAWGLGGGKSPKTVLRSGFGVFYDRFGMDRVMNIKRTNYADASMNQANYLVAFPGFNTVPTDLSGLTSVQPVVYAIGPNFKLPYIMQVAVTLERQVSKSTTVTASYVGTRGLHQSLMENMERPEDYT